MRGGVCLIDAPGAPLFEQVREGDALAVRGSSVFRNGTRVAAGHELTRESSSRRSSEQQGRVTEALEAFADNTMRYLREEGKLLAEGIQLPQLRDPLPRPPRAGRRARARVQARSVDRPALHPRLQARARRASTAARTRCSRPATGPT